MNREKNKLLAVSLWFIILMLFLIFLTSCQKHTDPYKEFMAEKKNWIQTSIKRPTSLHASLNLPEGKKPAFPMIKKTKISSRMKKERELSETEIFHKK